MNKINKIKISTFDEASLRRLLEARNSAFESATSASRADARALTLDNCSHDRPRLRFEPNPFFLIQRIDRTLRTVGIQTMEAILQLLLFVTAVRPTSYPGSTTDATVAVPAAGRQTASDSRALKSIRIREKARILFHFVAPARPSENPILVSIESHKIHYWYH